MSFVPNVSTYRQPCFSVDRQNFLLFFHCYHQKNKEYGICFPHKCARACHLASDYVKLTKSINWTLYCIDMSITFNKTKLVEY